MIDELFRLMEAGLAGVPPALIVIALLAGPTIGYAIYLGVTHRPGRGITREPAGIPIRPEYWQCPECLSLTSMRQTWCYACGFEPGRDDVESPPVDEPAADTEPEPAVVGGRDMSPPAEGPTSHPPALTVLDRRPEADGRPRSTTRRARPTRRPRPQPRADDEAPPQRRRRASGDR